MSRRVQAVALAALCGFAACPALARGGHGGFHGGHRSRGRAIAPTYVIIEEPGTAPGTAASHPADVVPPGGHLLVDSSSPSALTGVAPQHIIVMAFDRAADVQAWRMSSAYTALVANKAASVQIVEAVGLLNAAIFPESGRGPDAIFNTLPADKEDKIDRSVSNSVPDICRGC